MYWPDALTYWLLPTGDGVANGQAMLGTAHHARAAAPLQKVAL